MGLLTSDVWSLVAVAVALVSMGYAVYRQRMSTVPLETREQALQRQVTELQATVKTLLADRGRAEQRIEQLERELSAAKARIAELEARLPNETPVKTLLVGIGPDNGSGPGLSLDLSALRRVQTMTGLRVTRLAPVSKANLERLLERYRKSGEPIRYLHLSVHGSHDGILLDDGIADAAWLSENLAGVEVLVISGCETDFVADLIGVVPAVVSMREKIEHMDAMIFAEVFWMGIGQGKSTRAAFDEALKRCPPKVAEFVELIL